MKKIARRGYFAIAAVIAVCGFVPAQAEDIVSAESAVGQQSDLPADSASAMKSLEASLLEIDDLLKKKEYAKADETCRKALDGCDRQRAGTKNGPLLSWKSKALMKLASIEAKIYPKAAPGTREQALSCVEEAVQLSPNDPAGLLWGGDCIRIFLLTVA